MTKILVFLTFFLPMLAASVAGAQSAFESVAQVNDGSVTRFEVIQRERLLQALRRPDASRDVALNELIDDRLRTDAARAAGIVPTTDEIDLGVDDFAARAGLSIEEFLFALGDLGIEPETVRDYVAATLAWGQLVRTQFAGSARPSESEIDRALGTGTSQGSARVLLSEIILPMTPDLALVSQERAEAIQKVRSFAEFEAAARQFSVAPTRSNGGRLNWLPLSQLPPQVAPIFLTLQPGQVTEPVPIEGGIALFQFRGLQDVTPSRGGNVSIEYMRVFFPPSTDLAAERAKFATNTDSCEDIYGVLFGQSEDRVVRDTQPRSKLPTGVAGVVDRLDPGEIGILRPRTSAETGSLIMLCTRTEIREEDLSREDIAQQLFVQRLNSLADGYLAELRADAYISRK